VYQYNDFLNYKPTDNRKIKMKNVESGLVKLYSLGDNSTNSADSYLLVMLCITNNQPLSGSSIHG